MLKKHDANKIRGIRIRYVNVIVAVLSCILFGIILNISARVQDSFDALNVVGEEAARLRETIACLRLHLICLFSLNIMYFVVIIFFVIKPLNKILRSVKINDKIKPVGSYEFKKLAVIYNGIYEENMLQEELLRHRAEYDALTGVMNRGAFEQACEYLKESHEKMAFLIIDLDKFKSINDQYGHEMGDQVLRKVAKCLKEVFRATDFITRIGGDEFAVVVTKIDSNAQYIIREKVKKINRELQDAEPGMPRISVSVGVAFSERGYHEELYRNADSALYYVKEHGRCGCEFYQE